eukprot:5242894-Pleurochrysis_carterae.AAC.4
MHAKAVGRESCSTQMVPRMLPLAFLLVTLSLIRKPHVASAISSRARVLGLESGARGGSRAQRCRCVQARSHACVYAPLQIHTQARVTQIYTQARVTQIYTQARVTLACVRMVRVEFVCTWTNWSAQREKTRVSASSQEASLTIRKRPRTRVRVQERAREWTRARASANGASRVDVAALNTRCLHSSTRFAHEYAACARTRACTRRRALVEAHMTRRSARVASRESPCSTATQLRSARRVCAPTCYPQAEEEARTEVWQASGSERGLR